MVHALWLEGGAIAPKAPPLDTPLLFVCFVSQCMYSLIHPYIQLDYASVGGAPRHTVVVFFFTESFPELILCVC